MKDLQNFLEIPKYKIIQIHQSLVTIKNILCIKSTRKLPNLEICLQYRSKVN